MKKNNLSSTWSIIVPRAFYSPFLSIYFLVGHSAGWARSLHQCPCNLIHPAYLSCSVFFHTVTNVYTSRPPKQLEQWKGLPKKPFRQRLRGWLESFNSNKAGRKECLLLVIPPLARQGSARFICCSKLVHIFLFV